MTEVADINIRELASLAGVSIATVSRVINNPQLVQPDTREHVLEVMRRVNYAPAWTVESRLSSRSRLIAFLFSEADYYFYSDIRSGLESIAGLRGYTVLRVLKDFGDKNGEHRVFDYFAAGWNRDGLALRGMGELMKSAPADKHLLILLTDASPNDSHKILPSGKIPLSRDYDGQPGIDDTAAEVRALRAQGIRVAAVFMGENTSVPAANAIYGRDLARIRRIDQLAAAAGRLIQDEIRELSG